MTQMQAAGAVPELTLGWRMKMALAFGDVSVQQMADYLGVDRNTIGRWTGDKSPVKRHVILTWAMRTGVDPEWLEGGVVRHVGLEPTTRWLRGKRPDLRVLVGGAA